MQKNWFVILFQVDSTYISNSISQIGNSFAFHVTSLISLVDYQLLDFLFFREKWDQLFRNFTFKARLDFFGQFAVEYRVKFGVTCASYFTYLYRLRRDAFVFTRWMILNYYDVFGDRANLRLTWLWGNPPILNCADKIQIKMALVEFSLIFRLGAPNPFARLTTEVRPNWQKWHTISR